MSDFVVIPAYNESKTIAEVVKDCKRFVDRVIVVDDGSRDDTYKMAERNGALVLKHIVNLGKGAALKTGCDYAIGEGAERIVVLDADGQHDPQEIPTFLKELEDHDIIFGYREYRRNMPSVMRAGNFFINKITYLLFGMKLRDTQSGYRAFTAGSYKKIRWKVSDYSMESEMIANAGRSKLGYKEIPISTVYYDNYKGTTVFDGIKITLNMLLWRLR